MNPTDIAVDVEIGGEKYKLYFNLNAFSKFEEISGKKFPRFLFGLVDAWSKLQKRGEQTASNALLDAISEIGASDILALVHGAMHQYDGEDNPRWPLSPGRLGKIMTATEIVKLLPQIMAALQRNVPKTTDAADAGGEEPKRPTPAPVVSMPMNGGSASGGEVDPLDFLTVKSDG